MDIDPEPLGYMETIGRRLIQQGGYPASLTATTDLRAALDGADYVIVAILVGGREPITWDVDIPLKHGVNQCIADTMGPGGVFRAARTIPAMLEIAYAMEELCPDAVMLNYTNPMSMLCQAIRWMTDVEVIGLCHSVQAAHMELARCIGEDPADCSSWIAGINHQAWVLEFSCKGIDAYPRIRQAAWDDAEWYEGNTVRVEMLRRLDYYVTESSGHNSEYNPWFRKRDDLVERYSGEGFNGGTGYIKELYSTDRETYMGKMRSVAEQPEPYDLERGQEYGSQIMNALETGEPFRFNGTVANAGLITNLPGEVSVEVPCFADDSGIHRCFVGDLPPQLAALNSMSVNSTAMAGEAILAGDLDMLYWSLAYDPLTAARLSLAEIRVMVDEMFQKEKHLMPTFGE
jgi:alpha-galactosidase